jgi:hypothetical protein
VAQWGFWSSGAILRRSRYSAAVLRCIGGSRRWHNEEGKSARVLEEKINEKKELRRRGKSVRYLVYDDAVSIG